MEEKCTVSISGFEYSRKRQWSLFDCINTYDGYHLTCDIRGSHLGNFFNTYALRLKGKKEDIQLFLDYLRSQSVKVAEY